MYVQEIWARHMDKKRGLTMCRIVALIKEQVIVLCTHCIGRP